MTIRRRRSRVPTPVQKFKRRMDSGELHLARAASLIPDQAALDLILLGLPAVQRENALQQIRKHLKFVPNGV